MKALVALFIALAVVAIYFTVGESRRETDDRAAIHQLVDRYHDALRNGRYGEAAACYESTAFDGTGIEPAAALKQATELSGAIPPKITVDALRIEGDRAVCELLIDREGIGPASYVMKDDKGNVLGTWARTLHFVKESETWKIAGTGDNTARVNTKKAIEMLQQIQDRQARNKRNPQ